ncbi:M3 family metallopeptidase [Suttonella sp. R2A3]|uniref:M3 family metallopeptidase n=1 Tax=Suttonella sp. R2A3 TaxID=2908648 RepID=UPI001F4618CA|nr:M3 family metallopeptidase [Suttonella sp. R2A3]UJF24159.1 M3 family metallopeptidase [Suttonella sp. R2A3]
MRDFAANPLYHPPAAPDFVALKPEHVSAIAAIIDENREQLDELLKQDAFTWDNLILPLERMDDRLSRAFSPIGHLYSVCSTDAWRQAYEQALPLLSEYGADMAQHSGLYAAIKSLRDSEDFALLSATQKKVIDDALEDFERSGVALPDAEKARFKKLSLRLSELSTQFSNHVLDATDAWHKLIDDEEQALQGVPHSAKALMADLASQHDQHGFRVTLDAPVVIPILTYADDRGLRGEVYAAYNARASDKGPNANTFDNAAIVGEILALRAQMAEMLGFADFAALSVDDKMAKTPAAVDAFLDNLLKASKQAGEADMAELRAFAARELDLDDVQPWDVAYVSEKLRQTKYAISQEDLRPYFPVSKVLEGLFSISERLFGARFTPNIALSTWHKDVLAYDVLADDGSVQARFYLDLYARQQKRGGAWMDGAVQRFRDGETLQLPVAYLVCNFTPPVGDEEAYLTHDEVTTLFHEFGHGLHHMLSEVDIYSVSGINGVEWDAVEQPSQFMENFCYTREGLDALTRHKDSGEKLPDALFNKLLAAKNFQSAMAMLRQLEFSLFDMRIHSASEQGRPVLEVLDEVRAKVAVTPDYADNRFPMQFAHIFAGGYAAGYYSYKWAEVLSADSFSAFEEEGVFNPEVGARFRDEILAVGGARSSMESFVAFRGREPNVDALLRHNGISQ